jgi:hypothetical protein
VLSAIAIVPSAPVVVPELAAGTTSELADLREAMVAAAASLPARWVAIGVGPSDAVIGPRRSGTFAGYGVDVPVALSPDAGEEPERLPLCALIAGWLRGQVQPEAHAEVRVYAEDLDVDKALMQGAQLRAEIDQAGDPVGVLVVADGARTLTPPAPGGYNPVSVPVQHALDEALARGHVAALTALPDIVVGRVAYQVLAGLAGDAWSAPRGEPGPRSAQELYRGAPYGVGYFVGVWQP